MLSPASTSTVTGTTGASRGYPQAVVCCGCEAVGAAERPGVPGDSAAREHDGSSTGSGLDAASQHVKRLERRLGTPLLLRSGRSTRMTEAGRVLAAHADRLATVLSAAEREIADLANGSAGRVRVQAFPSALATLVPSALASLQRQHPGVVVQTTEALPKQARAAVLSGDCDVAIVFDYERTAPGAAGTSASSGHTNPEPVRDATGYEREQPAAARSGARCGSPASASEHILSIPLVRDAVHVILPADDALGGASAIPLAVLSERSWIAGCPSCRQHLLTSAAAAGFQPQIQHTTDDYLVAQSLVAAELGVALLPSRALAVSRHPVITSATIAGEVFAVSALVHPEAVDVPAVRLLLEALLRAAGAAPRPGLSFSRSTDTGPEVAPGADKG